MKGCWFKAKCYGWGWYPATWQGWFILLGYVLLATASAVSLNHFSNSYYAIKLVVSLLVLSMIFFLICYVKGEKLGWKFGRKK